MNKIALNAAHLSFKPIRLLPKDSGAEPRKRHIARSQQRLFDLALRGQYTVKKVEVFVVV